MNGSSAREGAALVLTQANQIGAAGSAFYNSSLATAPGSSVEQIEQERMSRRNVELLNLRQTLIEVFAFT